MKGKVAGVTAAVLAVLLALGYFFLPLQEERRQEGNSGRKKLEIAAGESQSWPWSPALEGVTQADLALSGLKNAGGLSLTVEIRTPEGQVAASRKENPGELQEESIRLTGDFRKGVAYTVNVSAEGEGSVKVRGVYDENKVFQPSLTETGSVVKKNANLLYFAAGLVLLSLAPLFGTPGRRRPRRRAAWQDLLPWGTFALILGVGLLVSLKKPAFTGLGQEWMTWDEEDHFGMIQNISLLVPGGIRAWLHGIITWDPGYMPLALGWSLGEILGLEAADCYRTATVFSTVCYASMCALAVSHAPKYKAAFLVAGTMPTFLFMMTSMTYDTVVAGSILLGAALVLETAAEEQKPSPLRIMTMTALLALGTVAKPAYSLALLLLWMIPAERLGGGKRAWLFRAFVLAVLIWCMLSLAMPGAYGGIIGGDERYAGADSAAQLRYMLDNPAEGGLKPLRFLWEDQVRLLRAGLADWAYAGNHREFGELYFVLLLLAAPLCVWGEKEKSPSLLTPGRRIGLAGIALGAEILLAYAQFLVSSEVGGAMTDSMQARYFMPVWILMALALMWPQKWRETARPAGPFLTGLLFAACCWVNIENAVMHLSAFGLI